jgi:hypothetical protein
MFVVIVRIGQVKLRVSFGHPIFTLPHTYTYTFTYTCLTDWWCKINVELVCTMWDDILEGNFSASCPVFGYQYINHLLYHLLSTNLYKLTFWNFKLVVLLVP